MIQLLQPNSIELALSRAARPSLSLWAAFGSPTRSSLDLVSAFSIREAALSDLTAFSL